MHSAGGVKARNQLNVPTRNASAPSICASRADDHFARTMAVLSQCALLLALFLSYAAAQTVQGSCEAIEGAPLSQCSSVIDYDVFVPDNLTQAEMDAQAAERTGLFFLGATSTECSEAALRFECGEVFQRCAEVPVDSYGNTSTFPYSAVHLLRFLTPV